MSQLPEEISPLELKKLIESGTKYTLIDVRDDWEVEICNIEGYFHCPLAKLALNPPSIPKNSPVVTYCHFGVRSRNALLMLQQHGFTNVASLKGGIDAWSRDVDPLIAKY